MELRQLEYFQMASRLKNITRAAERLGVSQPNITVAIKKLETYLAQKHEKEQTVSKPQVMKQEPVAAKPPKKREAVSL